MVDCYSFIVQNLNPFLLERKFTSVTNQHYVNMMCDKCMPKSFYRFIYLKEKFTVINQLEETYQKDNKIVSKYIFHVKNNHRTLPVVEFAHSIFRINNPSVPELSWEALQGGRPALVLSLRSDDLTYNPSQQIFKY